MWKMLLESILRRLIRKGALELTLPDGTSRIFGDPAVRPIRVKFTDPALPRQLVLRPEMGVGEGYMNGTLQIENDDLYGFLALAIQNRVEATRSLASWPAEVLRYLWGRLDQFNPVERARANVAHHYDLLGDLYDLFLDPDRQYSCAYFKSGKDSLETAQAQKKKHIADKLLISPGMRVLDIGCGWGGMAITLARDYGARVVGVTLSAEQHKLATKRAADAGLADRIDIRLTDYRNLTERFDRVVSVGMFEHVGAPHFREYFHNVRDRLTEDGIALIHTIGRTRPPRYTNPWVSKYIFPGGYCPSMSEVMAAIEKEELYPTDIEVWRLHYAETLRHWYRRFMANIDKARSLYDDRFCRMWRFYLVSSELTFRHDHQCVFHFQLTRRQAAVPLTRDYLYPPARPRRQEAPDKVAATKPQVHHAAK